MTVFYLREKFDRTLMRFFVTDSAIQIRLSKIHFTSSRLTLLTKTHFSFFLNYTKIIFKMPSVSEDRIENVGKILNDSTRPMKERFRALFTLKNIKGELAINLISQAFADDSDLLKHELAYCLGQMQDPAAIPILKKVLEDVNEVPMVRHEAGEKTK